MPYGPSTTVAGVSVGGVSVLAATGLSVAGWLLAAVTLILLGIALMQLFKPAPALRP